MSYCVGLYPTTSDLVALACGHFTLSILITPTGCYKKQPTS